MQYANLLRAALATGLALSLTPAGPVCAATGAGPGRDKAPAEIRQALDRGMVQDVIVQFEDSAVRKWAGDEVRRRRLPHEDAVILSGKASRFRALKRGVYDAAGAGAVEELRSYEHLPLAFVRLRNAAALDRLTAQAAVVAVFRDGRKRPTLDAISAALVDQPGAAALGYTGTGSAVLVIDSGVNYTLADFGSCTAPGAPSSCKVAFYADLTGTATQLDNAGHGTNISGIVVGTAPGAKIAMLNVFGADNFTSDSLILQAINWGIANRVTYSIRAINLSLGDGTRNTSACQAGNPYYSAIQTAWNGGLITVSSSGNEGYTDGIANPACTPKVVSVGAVYSANWGGLAWSTCTDNSTAADKVTCFSNSANFLTMLAPGALITAGGSQLGGTSQASPFVAGAVAVLRAAFPADTLTQTVARLTGTGVQVTDTRNGIVKPRLNLGQTVRPANDLFVNRTTLSGSSGAASGNNNNASKEAGEPNHAGDPGGASVWWTWTAPATGQVSLDTNGSGFSTLLAVYTGATVSSLTPVASRAGGGTLFFQAASGTAYQIAVDGSGGASGNVTLNWSLNTAAAADLATSISASSGSVPSGSPVTFTVTVRNNGPQTATGVTVSDTLPAGLGFVSATSGCSAAGAVVTCNLGSLANGGIATAGITALASGTGNLTNSASASSQLSDPVSSNNSAAATVTVTAAPQGGDSEVPTLPQWGMILLALALGTVILRGAGAAPRGRQSK